MNEVHKNNWIRINNLFLDDYFDHYTKLKYKDRSKILSLINASYRKWFYTTLVEETILTPCALSNKLLIERKAKCYTAPSLRINNNVKSGQNRFYFINIKYTLDKHPVVQDLFNFLEFCAPSIVLTEMDQLKKEDMNRLISKLSIQDIFYAEYLFDICVELELLEKIPSIYSNQAQPSVVAKSFFDGSGVEIFTKIFEATIDMFCFQITSMLPQPVPIFNRRYFLEMLKKPATIDHLLEQIYTSAGIDLHYIIETVENDESLLELASNEAILSSAYLLGIIIDRCFITPMGYYLKLIMPMYSSVIDFTEEHMFTYESLNSGVDVHTMIWSPCADFYLTPLGADFFKVPITRDNSLIFPKSSSLSKLLGQIEETLLMRRIVASSEKSKKNTARIFEIRARLENSKNLWFNFQILESSTLHDIHIHLCNMLSIDYDIKYAIYDGELDNLFSRYVSPLYNNKQRKTDSITLKALDVQEKQVLKYTIPRILPYPMLPYKKIDIQLEIVSVGRSNSRIYYPNTTRKSKAYQRWEETL